MTAILASLALLAYALATAFLILRLGRERASLADRPLGLLAILLHFCVLALAAEQAGGVDLRFFSALSLTGMGVAAVYRVAGLTRPIDALGVVAYPIAALTLGLQLLLGGPPLPRPAEWQILLHAALALIAFSVLAYAALVAVVLDVQDRALRRRRLGRWLMLLPPLTLTEALLFRLIGAGFALLTLGLLSGALFVRDLLAQHLAHKTVLSALAWLIFGALLYGRIRFGWRGRLAVRLVLAGMFLLLLGFFGSKFVLELLLHRV